MTETSRSPVLLTEAYGSVLHLTLNRPDQRNAISEELATALGEELQAFTANDDLRVAVLSGSGSGFCAGQDLSALRDGKTILPPGHPEWGFAGMARQPINKPLIAAVHGFAIGGGLEVALACDLLVTHASAKFALPEVSVGLFPAGGGVTRLPQQVPPKVAMAMALTGEPITGERAFQLGLASHLVEEERVTEKALDLASQIAQMAPLAVSATLDLMRTLPHSPASTDAGWAGWEEHYRRVFTSDDAREGVEAFLEKRAPEWTGQ